jgi:hypothetical protein
VKVFNRYILLLTVLLLTTTVLLAAVGEEQLDLYFAVYLIECLVVTLFFAHMNRAARRALGIICLCLFVGFLFVVVNRVLPIVLGVNLL